MGRPELSPEPGLIDLTATPPHHGLASRMARVSVGLEFTRAVESLGREENLTARVQKLCDVMRSLDTDQGAALLLAAGKLALTEQTVGIRVLTAAFNVKRPGVEVLRRLQPLTCLERTALQLIGGTWREPAATEEENPAYAIIDLFREAVAQGVLDIGVELLPGRVEAVQALASHLRRWFARTAVRLAHHQELPEGQIHFMMQLCMLEIDLIERRISRLAESIDPYDIRAMARLMPVLSRYDQDIEHMKSVVSRLATYEPFYERLATLEHALTSREMDKLQTALFAHPLGEGLAAAFQSLRGNPLLDRTFLFLVSVVHQIGTLRALHKTNARPPDLLSTIQLVADAYRDDHPLAIRIEPDLVGALWPILGTWGVLEPAEGGLELVYRDERAPDFITQDGCPRLPSLPEALATGGISIEDLVRSNMQNDAVILGVLENPRALSKARLIPLIAMHSRSIRVLNKIAQTRRLHSGATNKDVPRLLLMNPTRLPVSTLRQFIHVRFVSKTDLRKMASSHADIRSEIQREIQAYLKSVQ